ncbi:MAG TPA: enoyl-CoA hydratase/isomerase family protein [Micropepsaceae bacterium]|nr:enoyl-CoA hydratase/isomerase family protein [Micropepsaceae bacterium]
MESNEVLLRNEGGVGHITLNRPQALNALTREMCAAMLEQLRAWREDPAIRLSVIDAIPGRAFCAGGDIRAICEMGKRGDGSAAAFFTTEYRLNAAIRHFSKPYIALIDGIAMGGGVGVSIHGSHRVVSENALFAMPETAIGLFPDVGTTYVLPRLPGEIGMYLALTGGRIKPADMIYAGIATHFVPSARIGDIAPRLIQGEPPDPVLTGLTADPGPSALAANRAAIDRAFAKPSVEAVIDALGAEGVWGQETAALLGTRSPTSLKLTYRQMRLGKTLDFDSCLRSEYRLMTQLLENHDLYEGVRAALIDKDQRPYWRPATLDAVNDADISRYFELRNVTELSL